jgi:hypothetical protein
MFDTQAAAGQPPELGMGLGEGIGGGEDVAVPR